MIASRLPLIFGQPLMPVLKLRSFNMAPSAASSRRHIATSRDYIRCRSIGVQDERLLDPFIGRWKEVNCVGLNEFLEASGLPSDVQKFLRTAKLDLIYSKSNNQWTIDSGFLNFPQRISYTFKIQELFTVKMLVGPLMNCIVTQDGALWIENYESVPKPRVTMKVTNEVQGDKMTSVVKVKETVVTRIFARD